MRETREIKRLTLADFKIHCHLSVVMAKDQTQLIHGPQDVRPSPFPSRAML